MRTKQKVRLLIRRFAAQDRPDLRPQRARAVFVRDDGVALGDQAPGAQRDVQRIQGRKNKTADPGLRDMCNILSGTIQYVHFAHLSIPFLLPREGGYPTLNFATYTGRRAN